MQAIEDDLGDLLDSVSEEEASPDVGPLETAGISFDLDGNGVDTAVTETEQVDSFKAQQVSVQCCFFLPAEVLGLMDICLYVCVRVYV